MSFSLQIDLSGLTCADVDILKGVRDSLTEDCKERDTFICSIHYSPQLTRKHDLP